MNFRVNLAVALAAALSFACADKPAAIPELVEAMNAPPGMQVLGLYRMDITPVEGSGGRQFYVASVPVGQDGNATTNPANTVQIAGNFSVATTLTGPGACAGTPSLTATVGLTNFTVDPLTGVWVDVVTTMPVGFKACNAAGSPVGFNPGALNDGLWAYPNLAGSAVAPGTAPGGGTGSVVWGFNYPSAAPFRFFFRVMAQVNNPVPTGGLTASPTLPVTWQSPVSNQSVLEICSQNPGTAIGGPCPVALTASVPSTGVGIGVGGTAPFNFSYAFPTPLVNNQVYWYRTRNVFPAGTSTFVSPWASFTYSGTGPVVAPATFLANGAVTLGYPAFLDWTTNPLQVDTWAVICLGPCPAVRPAPIPGNPNILVDAAVQSTIEIGGLATYQLDVGPILAVDLATGSYWDPAAVYDVRVYDYDIAVGPPAFADPFSAGSITITPVQIAPVVTPAAPLTFSKSLDATWTLNVAAASQFTNTVMDICVPDCTVDVPDPALGTTLTGPAGITIPMTAGVGAVDVKAPAIGLSVLPNGTTFEVLVYNPDLLRVFPIPPVTPAIYTIAL